MTTMLLLLALSNITVHAQLHPMPEAWKRAVVLALQDFNSSTVMLTGPPTPNWSNKAVAMVDDISTLIDAGVPILSI